MNRIDRFCLWMLDREWAQWLFVIVVVGGIMSLVFWALGWRP